MLPNEPIFTETLETPNRMLRAIVLSEVVIAHRCTVIISFRTTRGICFFLRYIFPTYVLMTTFSRFRGRKQHRVRSCKIVGRSKQKVNSRATSRKWVQGHRILKPSNNMVPLSLCRPVCHHAIITFTFHPITQGPFRGIYELYISLYNIYYLFYYILYLSNTQSTFPDVCYIEILFCDHDFDIHVAYIMV